ncbi:MAG: penicillin-binding protein 2 [Lachnospiraceae bacterium]|nr:penicillin-binding protein 2 [Lachnospiraceae bacterium]
MTMTRRVQAKKENSNTEFAVITYGFLGLFIAMCLYFAYFITFGAEDFINNPYNARVSQFSENVIRGDILSSDGEVLATTQVSSDGSESRVYPYGRVFAHAVGYNSNGKAGVELDGNFNMLRSHSFALTRLINDFTDTKDQGDSVVTTLDAGMQQAAYNAFGNYRGAVVAIEPSTGRILTLMSKPDFEPVSIASNWEALNSDSDSSVLLNRATQGLYPPGSTFKILTALEYLNEGGKKSDTFDCQGTYTENGFTIHCYGNTAHGQEDLTQAFAKSCNVAFSQAGLSLDLNKYHNLAENMLFNRDIPTKLSNVKKSSFDLKKGDDPVLVMQTAIGQGNTLVTPLHMAMIAAAIDNDGIVMEPYIIDKVVNDNGDLVRPNFGDTYGAIVSTEDAKKLRKLMRAVVTDGTGSALLSENYKAYGKTGSAEYTSDKNATHSWFVGFAKKEDREVAVAIIMEGAGSGSSHAVPVARAMFDNYFSE